MEKKMFYGANPLLFARASQLRSNMTQAEIVLWSYLKTKPLGYKFRRQHPIGIYIADFFCYRSKLVIEVDGGVHEQPEVKKYDEERQKIIESENLTVIRFTNDEVIKCLEAVIQRIELLLMSNDQIKAESGSTPPLGGRGA